MQRTLYNFICWYLYSFRMFNDMGSCLHLIELENKLAATTLDVCF